MNILGVKKSEKEDLQLKIGIIKGNQITPDIIDRATKIIKNYYDDKGYKNAEVKVVQRPDVTGDNRVIVDVEIDKKKIQLDNPIKQTGEMTVAIKLYPEVTASLKVTVTA